jgi:hypothetical protein
MKNVPDKSCIENKNAHFVFNSLFFFENHAVYENVEKYSRAERATDGNVAQAYCMLND